MVSKYFKMISINNIRIFPAIFFSLFLFAFASCSDIINSDERLKKTMIDGHDQEKLFNNVWCLDYFIKPDSQIVYVEDFLPVSGAYILLDFYKGDSLAGICECSDMKAGIRLDGTKIIINIGHTYIGPCGIDNEYNLFIESLSLAEDFLAKNEELTINTGHFLLKTLHFTNRNCAMECALPDTIDVNNDGMQDFWFEDIAYTDNKSNIVTEKFIKSGSDIILPNNNEPLVYLDTIAPNINWNSNTGEKLKLISRRRPFTISSQKCWEGKWSGARENYMPYVILIDGKKHYGWIEMSVNSYSGCMKIIDYYFYDEPEKAILAGYKF